MITGEGRQQVSIVLRSTSLALVAFMLGLCRPSFVRAEVHVDLGASDVAEGLVHPQFADGNTIPVTAGGRDCRRNVDPGPGYPKDLFFYFTVDDAWAYQGSRPVVYVTIIYYDAGSGAIQLEYDSSDFSSPPLNGAYKFGGSVAITGTNTWKQHTFQVTDAWFGNRQQMGVVNGDFRIRKDSGFLYLDVVRASVENPWQGPMIGLNRTTIDQTIHCGEAPADDVLAVKNTGVGELHYAIEVDQPWLTVHPHVGVSAGEEASIALSYGDGDGLRPWWPHVATVTVYASDGNVGNPPQTITVTLFVETAAADFDGDCDVDQSDFGHLQACLGDPCLPPTGPGCVDCDLNGDGCCDALDVAALRERMTGASTYEVPPAGDLSQYIFFNKSPTAVGPMAWNQVFPATFTAASCEAIVQTVGTRGNDRLRIGVHFPFSILETPVATLAQSLQNLLNASVAADLPVLITLDGQNWWENRPDLWNWWDPNLPGFNLNNRHNVEWTGWSPDSAVKIGWRNWGQQLRVRPAPNIASPVLLAEHWARYDVLVPIVREWYRALPPNRKYLFGGLKVGWEASINVNAYYHHNGNDYLEQWPSDPSNDPSGALHNPLQGWTWGLPPLGYAAVSTSGIKQSGTLTKEDIEQVVHQYLERLSEAAYRRGIPRHLIFTHQGGTYAPWYNHLSFKPAMNDYSIPGWSFYSHDPAFNGSLGSDLDSAGRRQWAASEWWRGATDQAGWRQRFQATLGFKECRLICVYNWEDFRDLPAAHAAVRDLVALAGQRVQP